MIRRRIAVLSGKGGAGKTTIAVRLAQAASRQRRIGLIDADVEEPNAALLLRLYMEPGGEVTVPVAKVDPLLCTGCGLCAERCAFQALSPVKGGKIAVEASLCHGCGLCALLCPSAAIAMGEHRIGSLRSGKTVEGIAFVEGRLDVGMSRGTEIVHEVLGRLPGETVLVDGPPGCACSAFATAKGCDATLLVAQPTPLGVHDLELAVEMLERTGKPFAIVIDRSSERGDGLVEELARQRGVPILGRIPEDPRIADKDANLEATGHAARFAELWARIEEVFS